MYLWRYDNQFPLHHSTGGATPQSNSTIHSHSHQLRPATAPRVDFRSPSNLTRIQPYLYPFSNQLAASGVHASSLISNSAPPFLPSRSCFPLYSPNVPSNIGRERPFCAQSRSQQVSSHWRNIIAHPTPQLDFSTQLKFNSSVQPKPLEVYIATMELLCILSNLPCSIQDDGNG